MTESEFYEEYGDIVLAYKSFRGGVCSYEGELPNGKTIMCQTTTPPEHSDFRYISAKTVEEISPEYCMIKENGAITGVFHIGD